jgi:hypothetical protein
MEDYTNETSILEEYTHQLFDSVKWKNAWIKDIQFHNYALKLQIIDEETVPVTISFSHVTSLECPDAINQIVISAKRWITQEQKIPFRFYFLFELNNGKELKITGNLERVDKKKTPLHERMLKLDKAELQSLLYQQTNSDLVLFLLECPQVLKERIFRNISKQRALNLEEEIQFCNKDNSDSKKSNERQARHYMELCRITGSLDDDI